MKITVNDHVTLRPLGGSGDGWTNDPPLPDAVSGAATPAQQAGEIQRDAQDAEYAAREMWRSMELARRLPISEPWFHDLMRELGRLAVAGIKTQPLSEPAATPEAQIPECVHAPESRGVIELEPMTDKDAAAKLREIFDDLQTRFHDQWDWMDADFSLMVLEAFLEAARTESAALRVERDTIVRQANRLNDKLNAMRVERDQAWNEATEAVENQMLEEAGHYREQERIARNEGQNCAMDTASGKASGLYKATRMVRSLARPIPAEKPE